MSPLVQKSIKEGMTIIILSFVDYLTVMKIESFLQRGVSISIGRDDHFHSPGTFYTDDSPVDMDATKHHIQIAIKRGDVEKLNTCFEGISEQDVAKLLATRFNEDIIVTLEAGFDLKIKKPSPLASAIGNKQAAIFKYLMSYSPEEALKELFDIETIHGRHSSIENDVSLLNLAACIGLTEAVYLLADKFDVIKETSEAELSIHSACQGGDLDIVKCIYNTAICRGITDILEKKNNYGNTVLHFGAQSGSIPVVDWLFEHGASTEASEGMTILMAAADGGHLNMVRHVLENSLRFNVSINETDKNGANALFYSITNGRLEVAKYLSEHGAKSCRASDGRSLLSEAARKGHFDIFMFLLENSERYGVSVKDVDNNNWNIFGYAISGGNMDIINKLDEIGTEIPLHMQGLTPLHEAAYQGFSDVITHLLENKTKLKLDLQARDIHGCNTLMYAAFGGKKEILDLLREKGLTIEKAYDGRNLLMAAARNGHMDLVEHLLENFYAYDIDFEDKDDYGKNALFYPVFGGHFNTFKALIRAGIQPMADYDNVTLLMKVAQSGNIALFQYILNKQKSFHLGINDLADNNFWNPLMYAADGGKDAIIKILLENGAKAHKSSTQRTVLMTASRKGHEKVVSLLLDSLDEIGLSLNDCDDDGWNCVMHAVEGCNLNIIKYLLAKGAKVVPAKDGETVLMRAAFKNQQDIVFFFLENPPAYGLDINDKMKDGQNCSYRCIERGHLDLLKKLLDLGLKYELCKDRTTLLMVAAYSGNEDCIHYLMKHLELFNLSIHDKNNDGMDVLFFSIRSGSLKILQYFYNLGVIPVKANDGRTLLMEAVIQNKVHLVEHLLNNEKLYNINILDRDNADIDCLFYAVERGNIKMLELLLERGAVIQKTEKGKNIFMQAALSQEENMVKYLFMHATEFGIDVFETDINGWNCLQFSVCVYDDRIFTYLSNNGIPCVTTHSGQTMLMKAAASGPKRLVQLLLSNAYNQDIHAKDEDGWNAVFFAASEGRIEVFNYLLQEGGQIEPDNNNQTIIFLAGFTGKRDFVKFVIDKKTTLNFDLNAKSNFGRNCLFAVCQAKEKNVEILKLLIDERVPVENDKSGKTILMEAAAAGNFGMINFLIEQANTIGLDILAKDKEGRNALFYAVSSNKEEVFCQMMASGIPVDRNKTGKTVLMVAIQENKVEMVLHLMNSDLYGLSILQTDNNQCNALYYAAMAGSITLFEILQGEGAVLRHSKDGMSVLLVAAQEGKLDFLKYLVNRAQELNLTIHDCDKTGGNLITFAAAFGHKEVFDYCLDLGVAIKPTADGRNIIMLVMYDDHPEMLDYLIENSEKLGIDLNKKTDNGHNTLFYSVEVGKVDVFKKLISKGAKIEDGDDGESVIMRASYLEHEDMLMYLLSQQDKLGISIHSIDHNGCSAVHCTVDRKKYFKKSHYSAQVQILALLVEYGADLNMADENGLTPLHLCCKTSSIDAGEHSVEIVRYLLDNGSSIHANTYKGNTALHCCMESSFEVKPELLSFLHTSGADINAIDNMGRTPLMLACKRGWLDTVIALRRYGSDFDILDENGGTVADYCNTDNLQLAGLINIFFEGKYLYKVMISYVLFKLGLLFLPIAEII